MSCRICDSERLELVIDLGDQPWCNNFLSASEVGSEPFYPLRVVYCENCRAAQLDFTVKKEIMFGDHTYLSGVTKSLSAHFAEVAAEVDSRFFSTQGRKSVLDIGSNDGTQLSHFQRLGYDVLGVESSRQTARIANDAGVPTLNRFFNLEVMKEIGRSFDVFNAAGVFFHLEELHSVCEAIKWGLAANGVFVVQFLYMKSILDNLAFDQIYHEHLLYYTLETLEHLLDMHGLALFDARFSPIHGGSIVGFVGHCDGRRPSERLNELRAAEKVSECNTVAAYKKFNRDIGLMRERNIDFLERARRAGKSVFGFGAPVKGNTLLNYFRAGPELISCLVEKNTLRRGLYSPGMHIPVVMEDEIERPPEIYYVLAWNFKREILTNNQGLIDQGVEFYFPVNP